MSANGVAPPALEIQGLHKRFGDGATAVEAIADLGFAVHEGEFCCLVGPSGAGKTTLLRCLSGLMAPTSGRLLLHGRPIEGPPEDMALVFQDYSRSLWPWMTVRQNVEFPLRSNRTSRGERRELVTQALDSVGLSEFLDSYPWQLSGGMQQRVAIARALAYQPRILLMDEPFASVDAQTRADLEDLVLKVQKEYGVTVVFVTHDVDEAVYLGDRVLVLSARPASVIDDVRIALPQPRDQVATRELPEFSHLRAHVFTAIRRARPVAVVAQ